MKNPPPKVGHFSIISVISEIFPYCPELPKWSKLLDSCSQMWLIEQATAYKTGPAMHIADIKFKTRGVCFVGPRRTKL